MLLRRIGSSGRPGRAGQSLVELALALPVLAILLLGGFNTTILIVDKVEAGYAVRQGARLASEMGGCTASCPSLQTWDDDIVRNVAAVAAGMTQVTLQEIDIYQANAANGLLQPGDPQNWYNTDGSVKSGSPQSFTLSSRNQTPPNETAIGVRLVWTFNPPTLAWASLPFMDWAVMKAAPVLS